MRAVHAGEAVLGFLAVLVQLGVHAIDVLVSESTRLVAASKPVFIWPRNSAKPSRISPRTPAGQVSSRPYSSG